MKISPKKQLMVFFLDNILKKGLFKLFPDKDYIMFEYLITLKKFPNLNNPKTFNEKIQWIKLYGGLEKYTKYVDKYEVRSFISNTIGEKYLIPLIGVWDNIKDIPFNKLPSQFVLKATHGSGYNYICKDKSLFDIKILKNTITKWLSESFYKKTREIQYRGCKPRIICEKYMEDEFGGLTDYKIFCSNGEPKYIEVISGRFASDGSHFISDIFDINWRKTQISYLNNPHSKKVIRKPEKLDEMLEISKKLSVNIPFVRVDLYCLKNKIYFGELTLTPASGMECFDPPEVDYQLGELIDLSKY